MAVVVASEVMGRGERMGRAEIDREETLRGSDEAEEAVENRAC